MQAPKLRFKEFKEEWKKEKIGNNIYEIIEKTNDTIKYPLWSLTLEDGVTPKTERYERGFLVKKEDNFKIVHFNNFVYNPMNLRFGAIAYHKNNTDISVSGYYNIFSLNNLNTIGFWDNYFKSPIMIKRYNNIATGSLVEKKRVHYSQFTELIVPIPDIEEQIKISKLFVQLDKKIQLQKERIEALKIYKKGLMAYLFNNSSNKYIIFLKNICTIRKGQQLNKENMSLFGNYYVLNGGSELSGYTNNFNVQENTISISEGGNSCGFVNFNIEKFWAGGHCYILDNISQNINIYYLFHLLKYNQEKIMNLRVGSGLPNIQKKSLENFKLLIDDSQTQYYIYKTLNSLDCKIDLESNKFKNLNLLKKSLLQQMFNRVEDNT